MAKFSATVEGTGTLVKNIQKFGGRFLETVDKDFEGVRALLDRKVTERISVSDHSLADLAAMGHPYSRANYMPIHEPEHIVHRQSGELLGGKFSGTTKASVSTGSLVADAYVGIKETVKHALYVIYGTSKMVPRDFLRGSLNEVKDRAISILRTSLKNAVINFDGEKTKL